MTIVLGFAAALGSCSSSVGNTGAVWSGGPGQSEVLRVGIQEEISLPAELPERLSQGTQTTIRLIPLTADEYDRALSNDAWDRVDAVLTPAASMVSGSVPENVIAYGEDVACTMIDRSWFAANNLPIPTNEEQLLALKPSERAAGSAERMLLGDGEFTNLGGDARWNPLPDTCEQQVLNLVINSDAAGASQLADYLVSEQGQELVAAMGVAFPLGSQSGEMIEVSVPSRQQHFSLQHP